MKRNNVIAILTAVMILSLLSACTGDSAMLGRHEGTSIYLYDRESLSLEPVNLFLNEVVDTNDRAAVVGYLIHLMTTGLKGSDLEPTIPEEVEISFFTIEGSNVNIYFTNEYNDLDYQQEIFLRASMVRTITTLDDFSSVEFFVGGIPLRLSPSKILGRQYTEDVFLTYDEAISEVEEKTVVIYYPTPNKTRLVPVYVEVDITPDMKLEEIIVLKLIEEERNAMMPEGTKLLNIYTHEGICFVDFSSEFQTVYLPKGISERIAVYSLVNSLTELGNITNVQIMVEGELVSTFQGTLSLNRIFSKNFSLIEY